MSTVDPRPKLTIEVPGTVDAAIQIPVSLESSPTLANLASIFNDLPIASMTAHHLNSWNVIVLLDVIAVRESVIMSREIGQQVKFYFAGTQPEPMALQIELCICVETPSS